MRILCCALALVAAWAWPLAAATTWGPKALGLLIVGEGDGPQWRKTVAEIDKSFRGRYPIEFLYGDVGPRDLQRAVDRLQEAKARKIAVIPLRLSSRAADIDQIQYMLGLREYPSQAYMEAARMSQVTVGRVKAKAKVVMTGALDDDPLVASILLDRAAEMSREPAKETVILVGSGAADKAGNALRLELVQSLARKMAAAGRFSRVLGAVMRPEAALKERAEAGDGELRKLVQASSLRSRVLVVPYLLNADGTERAMHESLDGLFFRWTGKGLLYDPRVVQWAQRKAEEALRTPDRVKYRDAGKALPPIGRKKFVPY